MKVPTSNGPFILDKEPTTMQYGYYYCALLDVPFSKEKDISESGYQKIILMVINYIQLSILRTAKT